MEEYLLQYGYIALFLYSFGGGFLALVVAGVLAGMGKLDITTVLAVAFIANVIGDSFLFYMAKTNKADIKKYMEKHKRKLALTRLWIKKYGNIVVFLQKYIYGVKTLVPVLMGMSGYNQKRFNILNVPAAFLWALVFGLSSFYGGKHVEEIVNKVGEYKIYIILGIAGIAFYFFRGIKKK